MRIICLSFLLFLRFIRSTNMKGNFYHLTVNHFADMTDSEFQSHKGLMPGDGGYGSRDFDEDDNKENEEAGDGDSGGDNRNDEKRNKIKKCRYGNVPEELDWIKYGMDQKKAPSSPSGSLYVSGKLPTYPSPRPTLTLTSHLEKNVGLGKG